MVRKKADREIQIANYASNSGNQAPGNPLKAQAERDSMEQIDDPVHLSPCFTEEEAKQFKMNPDVMLLHIELDEEIPEGDRALCGIQYGKSIARDILVPQGLPLHNLHYAINQAFGFTNSHLHQYTFSTEDLEWVTDGKIRNWKKLIGLLFKNPVRDTEIDFWDDDYEGGSPKKWMRSKYTGPHFQKVYEEGYRYIREEVDGLDV